MMNLREKWGGAETGLFAIAIFASAFLLFLVQPMVGKRILPWFGGAPAVWTLCLAFYQSALFLGYAYAHLLIRFARPSIQLFVHVAAVAAALLALPVLPSEAWAPQGAGEPTSRILAMLLGSVAVPFMVLGSTGPLVQAWFSRSHPTRSPYPLYAVSNVGSLLALLAYPMWIEPRLPLSDTSTLWSGAFKVTALIVLGCAALARPSTARADISSEPAREDEGEESSGGVIALWLLLSGTAVIMLMGVTNKLCLDLASVPFLWILPLATYLVTFIISFASERTYRRAPYVALFIASLALTGGEMYWLDLVEPEYRILVSSVFVQIPAYCSLLFSGCMMMHGELYRLRPPARSLTKFYLCVSGGGALGGLFVGLLAPIVFDDYVELGLGQALVLLLSLAAYARDRSSVLGAGAPTWRWGIVVPLTLGVIGLFSWPILRTSPELRHQERGFFGVLRVQHFEGKNHSQNMLRHGTTLHGLQFFGKSKNSRLPTSYYGRATGVGMVLSGLRPDEPARIGVIGLGVGTLAAYGRAGDSIRFYEIDPAVIEIARDSGNFSYLSQSRAEIELVLGDARISLAAEQARGEAQAFDVLVVDAFNSDAVPIHLLTREAFRYYDAALAPNGLLVVHGSNRHFNLLQVVGRMGLEVGLESVRVRTRPVPRLQSQQAKWAVLARDRARLRQLELEFAEQYRRMGLTPDALHILPTRADEVKHVPLWTDDYSDLFSLLRRRW